MNAKSSRSRDGLKAKLRGALHGGTGTLVLAAAVLSARTAQAAPRPKDASIDERARAIRSELAPLAPDAVGSARGDDRLAWWGNWHNWGGWHPYWHNWPNWHNWHNWHNWGNW